MQTSLPSRVMCLRADNPSPMTGTGTNSYLIAGDQSCVLIDPGPALPAHHQAILTAMAGRRLEAILITHAHLDHTALAPALARSTGAPVLAFGDAHCGRSAVMAALAHQGLTGGGEGADLNFTPDVQLVHGQQLALAGHGLEVLHTPGHMGGHLCFAMGDILFSGDHVMGWSTSLVSPPDGDMTDYMASLEMLLLRPWAKIWPGHGAPIDAPTDRLTELRLHRRSRETQILAALAQGPADATSLAARIYTETPAALMPAASRNILAHLIDLHARNLIIAPTGITPFSLFERF